MTEDTGHQDKETKKQKRVENELMSQYLRNKFRQEHMRGSKCIERNDDTSRCVVLLGKEKVAVMVNSFSVTCSFQPWSRCCARVVRCSFPLGRPGTANRETNNNMHAERGNIKMVVAIVTAFQRDWPILVKQG